MSDSNHHDDFLFRGTLADVDADVAELIRHETARQARTLIMIPSESTIPQAVREALSSAFHNIYAEGYPLDSTRTMSEADILDYHARLPEYRRIGDNRYYKGTEYANIVESLARRRVADVFATPDYPSEKLFVNVQPLSGAPANSAVYTALLKPGDTIMSMTLSFGGHLSHGAPANRTGKTYQVISYGIKDDATLDYEAMMAMALQHKPKILIGGYSSYPLAPDWHEYRKIADACGALLMADIAHVAGMVAKGAYPSPIGIADIVTFTTHKTFGGPRGAVIITHRADLAPKLDKGVFPGEQGGPHVQAIAALAVAAKLAKTEQFHRLQHQTLANARRLHERLKARGLHSPFGGTDSHMLAVDCRPIVGPDGTRLNGNNAARILDLCGIVCNFQSIPGDTSALNPSGIRLGTPWITQRGFGFAEIDALADIIADVLLACVPYTLTGLEKPEVRASVPFDVLHDARLRVRKLTEQIGIDTPVEADGYPHFAYVDDVYSEGWHSLAISGAKARDFLNIALTSDVDALMQAGQQQITHLLEADGRAMASGVLEMVSATEYRLHLESNVARVAAWLRSLSDGYVLADPNDPHTRLPGPVDVRHVGTTSDVLLAVQDMPQAGYADKTAFVGRSGPHYSGPSAGAAPRFAWDEPAEGALKTTPLHGLHKQHKAKMAPFAGYEMPLWYDSVLSEHLAVRQRAGLFDVTHMGVFEAVGSGAEAFLDAVTTNDVRSLKVGRSHYTFLLDVDGLPLDDLLIYRLGREHFLLVVNASNNDKNWAWLNAVREGCALIDPALPGRRAGGAERTTLRDLRAESSGADRRVDLALQGPHSLAILKALGGSQADLATLEALPWAGIARLTLGGFDLLVSRTGYTGERVAYEVFPHPERAAELFSKLVELGAVPCGLAARDSLRTEAGLPLYGHELVGDLGLNPADCGMGGYVKLNKPFFVGKAAFVTRQAQRKAELVRFRYDAKGARPGHPGDALLNAEGQQVGTVTSCSIDSEGYQLGLAYVQDGFRKKGTALTLRSAKGSTAPVTVLRRFPER